MGIGASFLGGQLGLSVDVNTASVEHLRRNGHGTVLQLDITTPASTPIIHKAGDGRTFTATLGFPCQPWSSQGARSGMLDRRTQVFYGGLHTIWMMQCQAAVLECVPAAGASTDIRQALQQLASAMNWDILTTNLELAHQWPCHRRRWWALLIPRQWNTVGLRPWPATDQHKHVKDIIPGWKRWPEDEEQLWLTTSELEKYQGYGSDRRILTGNDTAATILHSYGNAMQECPCGCRAIGFSEHSLQLRGLRGFFVFSKDTDTARYLHPKEAGLLLGVPAKTRLSGDMKKDLCLLGLIASPLQMIWMYGTLWYNFAHFTTDIPQCLPDNLIQLYYKQEIIKQFHGDYHGILAECGEERAVVQSLASSRSNGEPA